MKGKTTLVTYQGKRLTLRELAEAQGFVGDKGYHAFRQWRRRLKIKETEGKARQTSPDLPPDPAI